MMVMDKALEDAQVRQQYRLERLARQDDELAAPDVPDTIPGYDGLLPVRVLINPLKVVVPKWEYEGGTPPGASDNLYAQIRLEGDLLWESAVNGVPLPVAGDIDIFVPPERIPQDGVFQVGYRIYGWNNNDKESLPTQIIIDRTPPYYEADPLHTPAALLLPDEPITDEYLDNHNDQVICQVPAYPDKARGDTLYLYWGPRLPESIDDAEPIVPPSELPDQDGPYDIAIPRAKIEERADGLTYAVYWLSDKAGNFSGISKVAQTEVQLGPLPGNLKPPRVPLDPISRADALEPVTVDIDAYYNPNKSIIRATWSAEPLSDVAPGPQPVFPLHIAVPWSVLKAGYDFTGPEEQTITVGYQAWRGPLKFPDDPLTVDVTVDLSIVGPENPDEPDPVNPLLPLPVLTSSQGVENKLDAGDHGQDATVEVELHAEPVDGEIIDLYWRDTVVASHTVNGEQESDLITFTLPWDAIEAGGNDPKFPLSYTIRFGNGMNPQRSRNTEVDVDVVTISLDAPFFPTIGKDNNNNPILNCSSLDCDTQALQLRIPGNSRYLTAGMDVVVSSQGYTFAGTEVPDTDWQLTYTLKPGEESSGATVLIEPYADKLLPILSGYLNARYEVQIDGQTVTSSEAREVISLSLPGSGTCPIVPC